MPGRRPERLSACVLACLLATLGSPSAARTVMPFGPFSKRQELRSVGLQLQLEFPGSGRGASAASGARETAAFFAALYLSLNGVALIAQIWIVPRLQQRLGLFTSLLVLPAALLGMAPDALMSASILIPGLMRAAEGSLKTSIHRVSWERAYLFVPPDRRPAAKLLIDGVAVRAAEAFAAVLLYAWLAVIVGADPIDDHDRSWITWILVAAAGAWGLLTRAAGRAAGRAMPPAGVAGGAAPPLPEF